MPVKIDSAVKSFIPEKFVPVKKEPLPQPKTLDTSSAAKKYEAQFAGDNLKFKLDRKLANESLPFKTIDVKNLKPDFDKEPPAPGEPLTADDLQQQRAENALEQARLEREKAKNDTIINGDFPIIERLKALLANAEINNELGVLGTERKIIDEHLSAIKRGDEQAIAFFDAMNQTNATGDPWDMNPGDAFRNSLDPEAQRAYDETLAALRNDPRIQFEFEGGAVDSLAFREIALRGLVAATFGRPQDLEERIANAAARSDNGKFTITYVPDDYVPEDGNTSWGAFGGRDGITAKQGFTVQQIANENDNLFIHEFSHTLQARDDGDIGNLPPDFGLINTWRYYAAFNSPEFQKYIGQTEIDSQTFATVQNHFRQHPQELKDASPEMYALMVDYSGFDPLTGSLVD